MIANSGSSGLKLKGYYKEIISIYYSLLKNKPQQVLKGSSKDGKQWNIRCQRIR
jgi:hypothetical protein